MMKHFKKNYPVILLLLLLVPISAFPAPRNGVATVSLNGDWQMGFARKYTQLVKVPGIAADPTRIEKEALWYRREVKLPQGNWTSVTLELKGARFKPRVYINGQFAGTREGGMAPVFFLLKNKDIKPGNTVILEIELASLKDLSPTDASYTPGADQWRTNVSSGLWDDVILRLHGDVSIDRIIPFVDYKAQKVNVQFDLNIAESFTGKAQVQIINSVGKVLIRKNTMISGAHNAVNFDIDGRLKSWSPDSPNLYHLKLIISDNSGKESDESVILFGVKGFEIRDKQFYLNNKHFIPRGVTVVWHRWVRTQEGRELGYDTTWFKKNIITRSKDHGANYLRFHLGLPPERLLDLCDRYGLVVQYEWSFFHGMPASKESLLVQYKSWLDLAMKHPCINLIHPYNETVGDQLKTAWSALDELLLKYPPLVIEDRDVIHIHKYWWSMFENLGLYYDSANVFPKAIMADEFGGNYLDEKGDLGGYPSLKESYLRFLGRHHTVQERLQFHAESNARIAEYWRRIGAAGYSPFCALGSYEDGNSWFMGALKEGTPKPVWNALTAAFSPRSLSIELWDKNFEPAQPIVLPVYLFNDEDNSVTLSAKITVENKAGIIFFEKKINTRVDAFSKKVQQVLLEMPADTGNYIVKGELLNGPKKVRYQIVSKWRIHVFNAVVPLNLRQVKVGVPNDEFELKQFLNRNHISTVDINDKTAIVILTSLTSWNKIAKGDTALANTLRNNITKGQSVVMLDVGDRQLGQGYPKKAGDLGPLQGVANVYNPTVNTYRLFGGINLKFIETAEPESYVHPDKANRELWYNLEEDHTGIWNGLRGGLIVPAASMEFSGLSANAFIAQWKARGASEEQIKTGPYYAYELQGFYGYSDRADDAGLKKKLKDKVQFLVQDAPSLASAINLNTPVTTINLTKIYQDSESGIADNFTPLANCAKNLTQTPVAIIGFGAGKGQLIVSQLLTSGRLAKGFGEAGLYGIRYDGAAVQYVLNMMALSIKQRNKL